MAQPTNFSGFDLIVENGGLETGEHSHWASSSRADKQPPPREHIITCFLSLNLLDRSSTITRDFWGLCYWLIQQRGVLGLRLRPDIYGALLFMAASLPIVLISSLKNRYLGFVKTTRTSVHILLKTVGYIFKAILIHF